jgi:hypothetical protein
MANSFGQGPWAQDAGYTQMRNSHLLQSASRISFKPPRVFISYSHDSELHEGNVLDLANRLRREGVDAVLDQYEQNPKEGWTLWMEKQIRDADFVLVVCTETYSRRVMKEEPAGKGLGACWEAHIIYQYLFDDGATNWRFIPLLFSSNSAADIPRPLRAFARYQVDNESGYKALYCRLTSQQPISKPPLGKVRVIPAVRRER